MKQVVVVIIGVICVTIVKPSESEWVFSKARPLASQPEAMNISPAEAAKATDLALSYFKQANWDAAADWYLKALKANPASGIAAEGFIVSSFNAGRYRYAYEIAKSYSGVTEKVVAAVAEEVGLLIRERRLSEAGMLLSQFPEREMGLNPAREEVAKQVRAAREPEATPASSPSYFSIFEPNQFESEPSNQESPFLRSNMASYPRQQQLLQAAGTAYESNQFTASLWNLDQAALESRLPRTALIMRGWSFYHAGRYDEAARLFEKLYQTQTDAESARGIVVALRTSGNHERLRRLAKDWGGILAEKSKVACDTTAPTVKQGTTRIELGQFY